jgi:hypothetical protein
VLIVRHAYQSSESMVRNRPFLYTLTRDTHAYSGVGTAILPAIPFWRWKLAKKADPDQWEMLQN